MHRLHYKFVAATLLVLVFITGCTGFYQAYEERVCWSKGIPIECNVHAINLKCQEVPVFTGVSRQRAVTKVYVERVEGPANPRVGDLFSQHGDKPIYLIGETAWETLRRDLEAIIRSSGVKILPNKQGSDAIVEANMTLLDVRSRPGGWLDFKIPTKAQASFEVKLTNQEGKLQWRQEFHGVEEMMVSYAFLEDSQSLLGEAYCHALKQFVTAFESVPVER